MILLASLAISSITLLFWGKLTRYRHGNPFSDNYLSINSLLILAGFELATTLSCRKCNGQCLQSVWLLPPRRKIPSFAGVQV
ncbi:hypothetical protein KCP73_11580 [Salmonella enterica subsp. enterica]|nr:hypothetical protein KCP73_11580 [Salmonella enterica subsp. enterica]